MPCVYVDAVDFAKPPELPAVSCGGSGELIGDFGPLLRMHQHVAATDIERRAKRQRHRLAGCRIVKIAFCAREAHDVARRPGARRNHLIARNNFV